MRRGIGDAVGVRAGWVGARWLAACSELERRVVLVVAVVGRLFERAERHGRCADQTRRLVVDGPSESRTSSQAARPKRRERWSGAFGPSRVLVVRVLTPARLLAERAVCAARVDARRALARAVRGLEA